MNQYSYNSVNNHIVITIHELIKTHVCTAPGCPCSLPHTHTSHWLGWSGNWWMPHQLRVTQPWLFVPKSLGSFSQEQQEPASDTNVGCHCHRGPTLRVVLSTAMSWICWVTAQGRRQAYTCVRKRQGLLHLLDMGVHLEHPWGFSLSQTLCAFTLAIRSQCMRHSVVSLGSSCGPALNLID